VDLRAYLVHEVIPQHGVETRRAASACSSTSIPLRSVAPGVPQAGKYPSTSHTTHQKPRATTADTLRRGPGPDGSGSSCLSCQPSWEAVAVSVSFSYVHGRSDQALPHPRIEAGHMPRGTDNHKTRRSTEVDRRRIRSGLHAPECRVSAFPQGGPFRAGGWLLFGRS
jgi:hypothetical protein